MQTAIHTSKPKRCISLMLSCAILLVLLIAPLQNACAMDDMPYAHYLQIDLPECCEVQLSAIGTTCCDLDLEHNEAGGCCFLVFMPPFCNTINETNEKTSEIPHVDAGYSRTTYSFIFEPPKV